MSETRYALYAVPKPKTPLARFAAAWLGWDIETGGAVVPVETAGLLADLHREVTAEPRRYGFHGTLKAPFCLSAGVGETELVAAIADFAAVQKKLPPFPLRFAALGRFLALVPAEPVPRLQALAADAVVRLDRFRAPLTETELARRNKAPLTLPQQALLQRWGYPYVLDQFRYHMTLTGSLDADMRACVAAALAPLLAPLITDAYAFEDVALCLQPAAGENFRVLRRFALASEEHATRFT